MNAVELLRQQHQEVQSWFKEYQSARSAHRRQELFYRIADALAAHSAIEEKVFYPAVREDEIEERLLESLEEHLAVKRVIADLLDLEPADETFMAKMKVLEDLVDHHIQEEQQELFPKVLRQISKEDLETMGAEMEAEFMALLQTHPRTEVPGETESAPPLE